MIKYLLGVILSCATLWVSATTLHPTTCVNVGVEIVAPMATGQLPKSYYLNPDDLKQLPEDVQAMVKRMVEFVFGNPKLSPEQHAQLFIDQCYAAKGDVSKIYAIRQST